MRQTIFTEEHEPVIMKEITGRGLGLGAAAPAPRPDRETGGTAMPPATMTSKCPHWCARAHAADTPGAAFYHASEAASVPISRPAGLHGPDRLDVQAAQYLPDEPGDPDWSPSVEITVHSGGRYRLIGLTPDEARELAADLLAVPAAPKSPAAPAPRRPAPGAH